MEGVVYQETIKPIFQIDTNHFLCVSRSKGEEIGQKYLSYLNEFIEKIYFDRFKWDRKYVF